jgi:broad specificity polyphosphatase/5'/3'-nucleotidase SurE
MEKEELSTFSNFTETTIEYFMNKKNYDKFKNLKIPEVKKQQIREKKFYKKRINNLTRQFMKFQENNYPDFLVKSFENYISSSIEYFKMVDHSDSLQNEYIGLYSLEKSEKSENSEEVFLEEEENIIITPYQEEVKSLFMNKPTTNTLLDTFITIKKEEKLTPMNIPQQKEINLLDPKFMVKGIIYN